LHEANRIRFNLNTNDLPEGILMVVVESEGFRQSKRLVITR
jgi:hypothetical protein